MSGPLSPTSGLTELTNAPLASPSALPPPKAHVNVDVALQQAAPAAAPVSSADALAAFFGPSSGAPAKGKVAAPPSNSGGGAFSADDITAFLAGVDSAPKAATTTATSAKKTDVGDALDFFATPAK